MMFQPVFFDDWYQVTTEIRNIHLFGIYIPILMNILEALIYFIGKYPDVHGKLLSDAYSYTSKRISIPDLK